MATALHEYDVVVVGAGPTGLTVANLLGGYGVRTLLVERNATTVQAPRAVSIDDESLRTMQTLGAIGRVLEEVVGGYGSEYLTPGRKPFLKVHPTGQPYGYPRRNAFRQPVLEDQLRTHLGTSPSVDSWFGATVTALSQDSDRVTLTIRSPEEAERRVVARYVCAADGASSPVRDMLGYTLAGETMSEKWLIVDLENSPAPSRETIVFCDTRRPCIALPGPRSTRRFEFKLLPGDDPATIVDDASVDALLEAHDVAPGSRIVRKVVYTFHARIADRWSAGRVFLAGDACHLTPPFAGQGMNSGIRDAFNLAWKLAWVVADRLPARILDSYEAERRPHVGEMIQLALRMGRIMGPPSRLRGLAGQSMFRLLGLWPPARDYFGQMKYKPKPRFSDGLIVPDGRSRARTAVGRLIPQPTVSTATGSSLLDDVIGSGFALIGIEIEAEALARIARMPAIAALVPKPILVRATFAARPQTDNGITIVGDSAGELIESLDRAKGRVFLVRPDRYVIGAFTPAEATRFDGALARLFTAPCPARDTPATRAEPSSTLRWVAGPIVTLPDCNPVESPR